MTTDRRPRAARAAGAVAAVVATLHAAAVVVALARRDAAPRLSAQFSVGFLLAVTAFAVTGVVVLRRHPRNLEAWVFLAIGVTFALGYCAEVAAVHLRLPAAAWWAWAANQAFGYGFALSLSALLLVFPDGRLPSPRWRPFAAGCAVVYVAGFAVAAVRPGTFALPLSNVAFGNPLGLRAALPFATFQSVTDLLTLVPLVGGLVSLAVRYRQAGAEGRAQLQWFGYGGFLLLVAVLISPLYATYEPLSALFLVAVAAVPVTAAVAILKYRLYDIEIVVNRTIVGVLLAGFVTVVYIGSAVGAGLLVDDERDSRLGASVLATAITALTISPLRQRAQRAANRVVYGERATPYDTLAGLARRLSHALAPDRTLPLLAESVAHALRADLVGVTVTLTGSRAAAATWPDGPAAPGRAADVAVPIPLPGGRPGRVEVWKRPGFPVTGRERALLADLVRQAGPALDNLRLSVELQDRLAEISTQAAELAESRSRLVAAQDAERRRLERDLHDGVQQRLVSLALDLRLARAGPLADPVTVIEHTAAQLEDALAELRAVAHGIHPAVLVENGLAAAIESLADRCPVPVTCDLAVGARYDPGAETAAYYIVAEALTNVAKHARATRVHVTCTAENDALHVGVADDGVGTAALRDGGGLRGLVDRAGAIGGTVRVHGVPGAGTTLTATLPCRPRLTG